MKNFTGLLLCLSLLTALCNETMSQDSAYAALRSEAADHFAAGDFDKALPLYRKLLSQFPAEPAYQFGTGVCLVNLNTSLQEAIQLLRAASLSGQEPLSHYYLGRALHLYYAFDDAIKAYSKFALAGKKTDKKAYDVERLITMARNGLNFTRSGKPVKVQDTAVIAYNQPDLVAGINSTGKLIRKPAEFCSKADNRKDYKSWMFMPLYTEVNEYIYTAGYEKGEKNRKQLFRIKNIKHQTWGFPEPLNQGINTNFDEEYPFFDPKTSTLYFSSKGHSTMGGYDIFKSVYNWNNNTWSEPENLGFPINSPYDDFAFITDDFNLTASFISNRNSAPGQLTIYRIKLDQDTPGVVFGTIDEIRQASKLTPEPVVVAPRQETADSTRSLNESQNQSGMSTAHKITTGDSYGKVLAEALVLQIRADSLARIVRDLRIEARETPDEELKKQLVSAIVKTDKEAKSMQREADGKFASARKLKPAANDTLVQDNPALVKFKEINGIQVYQYRRDLTTENQSVEKTAQAPADTDTAHVNPSEAVSEHTDKFVIHASSHYGQANPIPMGTENIPGLIYRIQLGVFSKPQSNDAFGGISPVFYVPVSGGTMLKYYAGLFYSLGKVTDALGKVRQAGFTDAFVVAYLDGQPISTEKAKEIEFAGFKL
ncbi:MAG: PD40 domain-containing protein [Bacteroidales bacterium]|nr:PD40 domain-containing protein [Bacteroidales bacterium]